MVAFIGLAIAIPIAMEDELVERTHQNKGFSLDKRPTIPSVSGLKFNIDGTTAYSLGLIRTELRFSPSTLISTLS
jgi:hypothetical protein